MLLMKMETDKEDKAVPVGDRDGTKVLHLAWEQMHLEEEVTDELLFQADDRVQAQAIA